MKIDALDHPKTIDLAASLGICIPQAIGHMELLWLFVGQKTPRGNVGRWSNAVIAHHAQWTGNPDDFVSSLIAAGFVDEDEDHRLLIHDWEDHMPRWVKAKLTKEKQEVISGRSSGVDSQRDSGTDSGADSADCSSDFSSDCRGYFKGREVKGSEVKGREGKGREVKTLVESASGPDRDVVNRIFAFWQEIHNHPKAKLDDKRRKKIKARLADGYSETDLMAAIRGCKKSPHHMGDNDTGAVYDDLELICRDGPHVDKFMRLDGTPDTTRMSGSARKTSTAAQRWLEESHAEQ